MWGRGKRTGCPGTLKSSYTIEIYIPRGEIMPFFSIPFGGGPQCRVIVYIAYIFYAVPSDVQSRASTTKSCVYNNEI